MSDNIIWKPVIGYEGFYEVSNIGDIRSISDGSHRGRILKQKDRGGYCSVNLCANGIRKTVNIHNLVYAAFSGDHRKPDKMTPINHKDGNKKNNRFDNLERVTAKENSRHAIETGLKPEPVNKRKVIDLDNLKIYDSASEAAEKICGNKKRCADIINVCKGKQKTFHNRRFAYYSDYGKRMAVVNG